MTTTPNKSNGNVLTATDWNTHTQTLDQLKATSEAKGDIVTHSATAYTRLAVGSNSQILVADSSATNGIKWGTGFNLFQTVTISGTTTKTVTLPSGCLAVRIHGFCEGTGSGQRMIIQPNGLTTSWGIEGYKVDATTISAITGTDSIMGGIKSNSENPMRMEAIIWKKGTSNISWQGHASGYNTGIGQLFAHFSGTRAIDMTTIDIKGDGSDDTGTIYIEVMV